MFECMKGKIIGKTFMKNPKKNLYKESQIRFFSLTPLFNKITSAPSKFKKCLHASGLQGDNHKIVYSNTLKRNQY